MYYLPVTVNKNYLGFLDELRELVGRAADHGVDIAVVIGEEWEPGPHSETFEPMVHCVIATTEPQRTATSMMRAAVHMIGGCPDISEPYEIVDAATRLLDGVMDQMLELDHICYETEEQADFEDWDVCSGWQYEPRCHLSLVTE